MGPLPDDWTLPGITALNQEWFESGAIRVQACTECGTRQHPPEEICHHCGSMAFTADELGPHGEVHSYTIVHYPANKALAESVPYAVVLVALDDDSELRIVGNLLDTPTDEVRIGMKVTAHWIERSDGDGTVLLPQWTTK